MAAKKPGGSPAKRRGPAKRRKPARKNRRPLTIQQKAVLLVAGVLVLAVFTALMMTWPQFSAGVYRVLGIQPVAVPQLEINSPVAVHVIDVGQGDAVLLEADGEYALVDAGTPEAESHLLAYLHAAGVQRLRYVFMTHPHADHIGAMTAVVRQFPVDLVVLPNFQLAPLPTTSLFENLLKAMTEHKVPAETALQNGSYPLGGGSITVLHAGLASNDNYNLLSLGLLFEAGGLRVLNTGDGEKANEKEMLGQQALNLHAQVFIAAHHGSSTSNTQAFLQAVRPQMVVVSCAAGNSHGHPHRSPLEAYEQAGAQVLRTDQEGNVVIAPDGNGGLVYATNSHTQAALAQQADEPVEALPPAA